MSGKGGMSNYTAVANRKTAAATLREQHVRRVVDAAQDSHSASTTDNEGVRRVPRGRVRQGRMGRSHPAGVPPLESIRLMARPK